MIKSQEPRNPTTPETQKLRAPKLPHIIAIYQFHKRTDLKNGTYWKTNKMRTKSWVACSVTGLEALQRHIKRVESARRGQRPFPLHFGLIDQDRSCISGKGAKLGPMLDGC